MHASSDLPGGVPMQDCDDIVIGAGSSGAIVAARLSAGGSRRVLLIEAGPDCFNGPLPAPLASSHEAVLSGYNWDFKAQLRDSHWLASLKDAASVFGSSSLGSKLAMAKTALHTGIGSQSALTRFNYPLGKLVGGSSAINGALALPPLPQDMQAWVARGNSDWGWQQVLPYLEKIIAPGTGAISLQQPSQAQLHPVQQGFMQACQRLDFPATNLGYGQNPSPGVGIIPRNLAQGIRQSTAITYLRQARSRANFQLLADSLVQRILMEGGRARGVEVWVKGELQTIAAERVILCAGAIQTPCLLMRSGIGDPALLAEAGIASHIPLPGVGANLMDHTSLGFWMVPQPGTCQAGEDVHQVMLRCASASAPAGTSDLQLYAVNSMETRHFPELKMALGSDFALSITLVLGQPESRGRVRVTSPLASAQPDIVLNLVSSPADMERLKYGARLAWQLAQQAEFQRHVAKTFAWNPRILHSDALLEESILTFARGSWHIAGTAAMGPASDPQAVVNQQGAVYGCDNLYVADASLMPCISTNPTNLTTMMIAEKISAGLLGEAASSSLAHDQEEEFVF